MASGFANLSAGACLSLTGYAPPRYMERNQVVGQQLKLTLSFKMSENRGDLKQNMMQTPSTGDIYI